MNGTGSSLVFLCEVFAFPMALVEWRKEGRDVVLPGDDPHISVQVQYSHTGATPPSSSPLTVPLCLHSLGAVL